MHDLYPFVLTFVLASLVRGQCTSNTLTQAQLCLDTCIVAAQCNNQCLTEPCLCQGTCVCAMRACQSCCTASGGQINNAFCQSNANINLAYCALVSLQNAISQLTCSLLLTCLRITSLPISNATSTAASPTTATSLSQQALSLFSRNCLCPLVLFSHVQTVLLLCRQPFPRQRSKP